MRSGAVSMGRADGGGYLIGPPNGTPAQREASPPVSCGWLTEDVDQDGEPVWKRTKIHAWRELYLEEDEWGDPAVEVGSVTLCGIHVRWFSPIFGADLPLTCGRCARSLRAANR